MIGSPREWPILAEAELSRCDAGASAFAKRAKCMRKASLKCDPGVIPGQEASTKADRCHLPGTAVLVVFRAGVECDLAVREVLRSPQHQARPFPSPPAIGTPIPTPGRQRRGNLARGSRISDLAEPDRGTLLAMRA